MSTFIDRRRVVQGFGLLAASIYQPRLGQAASLDSRPPAPVPSFDHMVTAEQVTDGLDLTGKLALVTGCNSGIGYETMRGAHVLGAARTQDKAEQACASVVGKATPLVVELTDFDTIVAAADVVQRLDTPLDMLICNAGVMGMPERELVDGIEKHFVVNHLGHFILVNRLLEPLEGSPDGRVAVVSSTLHMRAPEGGIKFDDLAWENDYDPIVAYGHSKLANVLFARSLAERLANSRASANSLHPGVIKTNLIRHMPAAIRDGDWDDRNIEQGAATSCYVASHPDLKGVSGHYFAD